MNELDLIKECVNYTKDFKWKMCSQLGIEGLYHNDHFFYGSPLYNSIVLPLFWQTVIEFLADKNIEIIINREDDSETGEFIGYSWFIDNIFADRDYYSTRIEAKKSALEYVIMNDIY